MNPATQFQTERLRHPAPALFCLAAAVLTGYAPTALALDLDGNADLITETIAGQDRRRSWDQAKQNGARPVGEADRSFAVPEGVRVGNFFFYPTLSETAIHDSNLFGSAHDPVADWRFVTAPSLVVQSQMPRHVLDVALSGKFVNHADNTDQDYANFGGLVRGAVHIDHAHTLSASLLAAREHEERGASTADLSAAEPVPVDRNRASVGITRDVGRLYGTLAATAESWDYHRVKALDGSTLDQDRRDQTLYSAHLRTGYRISPGYEVVSKLRALRQYNDAEAPGRDDRNSTGYEGMVGLAFEANPLFKWRLMGGYGERHYDRDDLEPVKSTLIEAEAQWLPTERLTLFAHAGRSLVDEIGASDNGRIETSIGARADYEVRHDLIASLSADYAELDFLGSDRKDDVLRLGVGLEYLYSKHLQFSLGYAYENRASNEADFDMDRSQVRIGAKLKY